MRTFQLVAAGLLLAFAGAMWWGFLREVPETTLTGVIEDMIYKPEGEYQPTPTGTNRGFRGTTGIPMAEGYIFHVRLDDSGEMARAALNMISSQQFKEGDRVRVGFQRRGFPPLWERITVTRMDPLAP
jgi:hypothetical protein